MNIFVGNTLENCMSSALVYASYWLPAHVRLIYMILYLTVDAFSVNTSIAFPTLVSLCKDTSVWNYPSAIIGIVSCC